MTAVATIATIATIVTIAIAMAAASEPIAIVEYQISNINQQQQ